MLESSRVWWTSDLSRFIIKENHCENVYGKEQKYRDKSHTLHNMNPVLWMQIYTYILRSTVVVKQCVHFKFTSVFY
jgi:hypothetical protein